MRKMNDLCVNIKQNLQGGASGLSDINKFIKFVTIETLTEQEWKEKLLDVSTQNLYRQVTIKPQVIVPDNA